MARIETIEITDDLDGSPATGTVRFGLDGKDYAIDLSDENRAAFAATVAPYVAAARQAARPARTPKRSIASRQRSAAIRQWARERGHHLGERGRLPASVVAEYEAATSA